ncbi:Nin1 binding protein [Bulinus truncatus]|nr:Nin1 binding protein [Bulinus truncatus]
MPIIKVKHVVADAGAFIRNAPLREIAENVYTVPEVIAESIDRNTRRRLKLLPININFKEPSADALQFVSAFAKKTGDYKALSAVDLKILALAYDLEKQFKGTSHIRTEPPTKPQYIIGSKTDSPGVNLASKQYAEGEALPTNLIGEKKDDDSDDEEICDDQDVSDDFQETLKINEVPDQEAKNTDEADNCDTDKETLEEVDNLEESEDNEASDDEDGWITPSNITEVKRSMGIETAQEENICIGCLTTDFAMQNVLIQMGLNILSVDGMLIKKAKSYVLRCFGCLRITKDTSKVFCPHCGNKTLKRLSTTIEQDGSIRYWLAKNYTIRTKGMKYALPKPQGGKHAVNPMLCADQPFPDQRPSKKSLQKIDILSDDIIADMSPFTVNDVTSRAAQLGITGRQWMKRNPNDGYRGHIFDILQPLSPQR